jgi:hypothetical protein
VPSKDIVGFDANNGKPLTWPLRYGMVGWSATLRGLKPGAYEVRARAVDMSSLHAEDMARTAFSSAGLR